MRDYDGIAYALKGHTHDTAGDSCSKCPIDMHGRYDETCFNRLLLEAADAIEELQSQIAEAGKMVDELITYAQKNADESREAEKRFYGDDFTVSRYTWIHNQKCTHERYVEKLERIAMMLPGPPKEDAHEG